MVRVMNWQSLWRFEILAYGLFQLVRSLSQEPAKNEQMPGIMGAIGCAHFRVVAPDSTEKLYLNKKGQQTLTLQAVVDSKGKFINITGGEPGSLSDHRILQISDLSVRMRTNFKDLLPNNSFVLGGLGYAATSWVVPPFRDDGNLTDTQLNFNSIHATNLKVVVDAFVTLKSRCICLQMTHYLDLDKLSNLIVSTCILHNICVEKDDLYIAPEELTKSAPEIFIVVDEPGNHRDNLFNCMQEQNII